MPGTIPLKTPRLTLRRHELRDAEPLYRNFGLDEAMFRYSGWNPYATPEAAEETVRRFVASYADPRFYGWAVERDGRLIGTVGAYDYDAARNRIEVGFSVERASWGRGYAAEALRAVLLYLTEQEGIARVTAWCAGENAASRRTMEKAGMRRTGAEPDGLLLGGRRCCRLDYAFGAEDGGPQPSRGGT